MVSKVITRDLAAELILELRGACKLSVLAGVNGNIPSEWTACDLTAHPCEPYSPEVAVFCDAKRTDHPGRRAAGARVVVVAGSPEADKLRIADKLAEALRAKIAVVLRDERGTRTVRVALATSSVGRPARLPQRKTSGSSGYDLNASESITVPAGGQATVETGVHLELPPGWEAQIRPRSGLTSKGIWCALGSIDSDYRGGLGVILANLTSEDYEVSYGDRIAQLVFNRVELPDLEVVTIGELEQTERGSGGFGSTGR